MNDKIYLPIIVEIDEDSFFIVSCPSIIDCRSYGKTTDEAMSNIKEAIEVCLEDESPYSNNNKYIGAREHTIDVQKRSLKLQTKYYKKKKPDIIIKDYKLG